MTVDCEPVGTVDINVDFIRAVDADDDYIIVKSKVISIKALSVIIFRIFYLYTVKTETDS